MSASLSSNDRGAENRRSTRLIHAVPVTIRGLDALGQSFEEFTSTVTVNCNGCKYESKHYVPKGSRLTIEIGARRRGLGSGLFPARVVWVQRPRTYREIFHIAVEFEVAGNVWDIKSPPGDWFPHPDDEELIIPVYPEEGDPAPVVVVSTLLAQKSDAAAHMPSTAHAVLAVATPATTPSDASIILDYSASSQANELELEAARLMVRSSVEAAMIEEMTSLRQRLESQLQESVQETVKSLAERIAERILNAVVEQTTERTAATVAEARETCQGNVKELDAKIRFAARDALSTQPESLRKSPTRKRARKSPK